MSLAPGLYAVPPRTVPPVAADAVDVPAFVGLAERGPLGQALAVQGWPGFRAAFGDMLPNAQLAWAVRGFFENGGRRCYVVRVAAPPAATTTDPAAVQPADRTASAVLDPLGFAPGAAVAATQEVSTPSSGAQPADRASSVLLNADGFVAGSRVEVAQGSMPRVWRTIRSLDPATGRAGWDEPLPAAFDVTQPLGFTVRRAALRLLAGVAGDTLAWQRSLPGDFSLTQPIAFATGAAPAEGVLYDETGLPLLRLVAASAGAFGNAVEVRLTRSVSAETQTRSVPVPDDPGALSAQALADFPPGATVTIAQDGVPAVRRYVGAIDAAGRRIMLDQPLPVAFDLLGAAAGTKPIALRRETFALIVLEDGKLAETWAALDLPAAAGATLPALDAGSNLVRAQRLAVAAAYPLPDPVAGPGPAGSVGLAGGRDGIAALLPGDLIAGLGALVDVDEPAAVAVPDAQPPPWAAVELLPQPAPAPDPCALNAPAVVVPPEAPAPVLIEASPALGLPELRDVQQAAIAHCEQRGDRVAVLDAPRDLTAADPYDPDAARDWRVGLDSRFAALYWPWLRVLDLDDPAGTVRELPPCGHALGTFAASDAVSGAQKAPANTPLDWVQGVTRETDDVRRGLLNDAGVNVVRVFASRGIRIYGARTLSPEPDYRLLNVRRILIQLRRSLLHGLAWVPFEPDNPQLRVLLRTALEGFLGQFWQRGRLSGATRAQAFNVAFDPPGSAGDGTLVITIGVAPVSPAEFVYLTIARADEAIDVTEQAAPAGAA